MPINTGAAPPVSPASPPLEPTSFISEPARAPPSTPAMPPPPSGSASRWVNPAKEYDHRHRRTPAEASVRSSTVPYPVEQYVGWSHWYFDALRFQEVCQEGISLPNGYRRSRDEAWTARWRHLPLTPNDRTRTHGRADLSHVRCWPEREYQVRLQNILSGLQHLPRPEDVAPGGNFLPAGHSVLGLLAFEPPYDRLYWLRDRRWWGDNCSDESRVRNTQWLFYGWHNLEFFDMPSRLRPNYYIRVPPQPFYRDVPRSLCVPTPSVLAYHGSLDLQKNRLRAWLWQIVAVEWAVSSVMAFLHAARYGIQMNAKNRDWRLFQDRGIASPVGRLLPLPTGLISYVRELGVQNIVRGTEFDPRETETLLRYAAETDWTKTPGFLWYDYETDRFSAMPRHPGGHDDGKAYPTRVVLPESRRSPWPILEVADYYPRGKGFVPECFHPLEVAPDAVPIFPPNSHGAVSAVPSQYGGESIVAPADERGLVSYDDEDVPAPVPVAHLRSALPPRRGVGATQSAVAVVDDVVEVPASSPPTGATDNFVAARPELVMETFDQVDVPPIVDEDLKAAWKDYLENARNYGAEPAATVPAVLRQAATLIRDSHTLERTRSALNEVQSALSGILQARVRDVTDGAISDVLVRFGLEPDRSAGGGADGASASNSTGGPARKRPRPGTPTSK